MLRKFTLVTVALIFYAYSALTIAGSTAATKPAQLAQERVANQKSNDKHRKKINSKRYCCPGEQICICPKK